MNSKELFQVCQSAIIAHIGVGGKVKNRSWGFFIFRGGKAELYYNCGCALSILTLAKMKPLAKADTCIFDNEVQKLVYDYLPNEIGVNQRQLIDFQNGFDDVIYANPFYEDFFTEGRRFMYWVKNTYPDNSLLVSSD